MDSLRCGICNSQPTKYKCPTCRTSSCSLACFKQHQSACAEIQAQPSTTLVPTGTDSHQQEHLESSTGMSSVAPTDLNDVFRQYPNLREQLRKIYKSTRDPAEREGNLQDPNSRGFSKRPWKPERGFENGLATLNRILQDETADSDSMAAFMKLLADKSAV